MQIEDSEFEIFIIPIVAGVALQSSDLTVDHFQLSDAATVFVQVQDKWLPFSKAAILFSSTSPARL